MKLLITGAHVTPALAVIDEINRKHTETKITFVGRKFASSTERKPTFEYEEIAKRKIPFIHLTAGRYTRAIDLNSLKNISQVPVGFFNAMQILRKEKPDKVLSFGGYLALPIAFAAYFLGIPTYTHEQTIEPGLANKAIAKFAKKIFVSFPETASLFDRKNTIMTGNPVRKEVFKVIDKPFKFPEGKQSIYITGGSLGAHSINVHVEKLLARLVSKYFVIHQTGNVKEFNDYERLLDMKETLPEDLRKNYIVETHFSTNDIGYIYKNVDLVISRAGANTFFELGALKKPVIFIPLPWSAHGEQEKHADIFYKAGVGQVFDQDHKSKDLLKIINEVLQNLPKYQSNFDKFPSYFSQDAAKKISDYIHQD